MQDQYPSMITLNPNQLILYYVNAWKKPQSNIILRILVTDSNQLW